MVSSCIAFLLSACGNGPYDLSNKTDREALKFEVKQALTQNDCVKALSLITPLYESTYSDNDARMYYASSHGCNIGIQLYTLLDSITTANFATPSDIFKSFVRLFPSTAADSRLASSWYAQDALQTILNPGTVIASYDQIAPTTVNPGSVLSQHRTLDANTYMVFIGMSVIGTGLNRYGYTAAQTPASLGYGKGQNLPWTTRALVQADTTGSACAIVSGLYNMFDGITAVVTILSGGPSGALTSILSGLQSAADLAGSLNCTTDGYSAAQCSAAAIRVRYRGACSEQAAAASFTAGVISGINASW